MRQFVCDIKACSKAVDQNLSEGDFLKESRYVTILDKQYLLCNECVESMKKFLDFEFQSGRDIPVTSTKLSWPNNIGILGGGSTTTWTVNQPAYTLGNSSNITWSDNGGGSSSTITYLDTNGNVIPNS